MPAYQKSINLNHGYFVVGVCCYQQENPFFIFISFFLFLGVLKALVQASFRAYKATKIVQ